ncbi:MAG: VCBS repeat-containing protein [Pseudomonadota bacterium]
MRRAAGCIVAIVALAAGAAAAAEDDARVCVELYGATACYDGPVARYGHAVLGDTPEWSVLSVRFEGESAALELPEDRIFEDVSPRLVRLSEGAAPAVVAVEASADAGARLVMYVIDDGALRELAATPPIGTRNRWLAPAAWTDLNGDGVLDLAYVDRPHLAGVLRAWSFGPDGLAEIAAEAGFSNHRIGDAFIASAVRVCDEVVELVLPDFRWSELRAARLTEGGWVWRRIAGEASRAGVRAAAAQC